MPFDPVDFQDRTKAGFAGWPIGYDDLQPWWQAAGDFLGSRPVTEPAPGAFARLASHDASHSECWGSEQNMKCRWWHRLTEPDGPAILLDHRVTGFDHAGGNVTGLRLVSNGVAKQIPVRKLVLACSGLGVLRLLLNTAREAPDIMTGRAHLGHGYMGHLTGAVADLVPAVPADIPNFEGQRRDQGMMTRRRIMPLPDVQIAEEITNIAFWLDNPPIADASHGSGQLSAKYLLLILAIRLGLAPEAFKAPALRKVPEGADCTVRAHMRNMMSMPLDAALGLALAVWVRLIKRNRHPGRLIAAGSGGGSGGEPAVGDGVGRDGDPAGGNGWRLHYHAEQRPDAANRISLSDQRDPSGQYRLKIDYGFADADIASVMKAHALLDRDLRQTGVGAIRYLDTPEGCLERIRKAARDGYHQIGGTRMSHDSQTGVVDPQCRVHGVDNLWIASSSVFPRAGQANPTMTIVALACRLADHLASHLTGTMEKP